MYPKVIIHRLNVPQRHRRTVPAGLLRTAAILAGSAVLLIATL